MLNSSRQKSVISLYFVSYAHLYARVCDLVTLKFLVASDPPTGPVVFGERRVFFSFFVPCAEKPFVLRISL